MFDLSIILPTRNRADSLLKALMDIERHTACDYEVVVINQASTDPTDDVLALASSILRDRLRSIRQRDSIGFALACNKGISLARGRYVCVLRDDVYPSDGALSNAVMQLDALPDAAKTLLAPFASPDSILSPAVSRNDADGPASIEHVAGTLVTTLPIARRETFGMRPLDEALKTDMALIDFSLRAWSQGVRIVPANSTQLTRRSSHTSIDDAARQAELNTVIAHWNLPRGKITFDPSAPCTLDIASRSRAA